MQPIPNPAIVQPIIQHSQYLLNSFKQLTGRELIDRTVSIDQQAFNLFYSNSVVVSHNTAPDPIFNYGNQSALDLWEFEWNEFITLPSRLSAEIDLRDTREQLLQEAKEKGYISSYQGIRISRTGRRFWIENATIWNVHDEMGNRLGQAATFSHWTPITPTPQHPNTPTPQNRL